MLFVAFSSFLASGFLVASLIPGLRSGSNAVAFFSPHLSGVTPKEWLCHDIVHSYRSLMLPSSVAYTANSGTWVGL